MNTLYKTLFSISLLCMASTASAVKINGEIHLDGSGTLDAAPPSATELTMNAYGEVNENPAILTGDFDTYLNPGDFSNTAFSTTLIQFAPTSFSGSIANFWTIGGFSFELKSLSLSFQNNTNIVLDGAGILTGNGFEDTDAQISIVGTGTTTTVSITSTTTVPEPLTLSLLGIGLVGIGATRRRRLHKTS